MLRVIDKGDAATGRPFTEPRILRRNLDSRRFGWTHYGVMIPDLPEPHRYLSLMRSSAPPARSCSIPTTLCLLPRAAPHRSSAVPPRLQTEMDTPFTYGLGSGFVSGFAHTASWCGAQIAGRGYVEHIDGRNG